MSTKERLGLDLVATDKSGAAFASFTKNLTKAKAETRSFGYSSNLAFQNFSKGLAVAASTMGVSLGVGALAAFAKSAISDLANIKDQAERAGLAISDMQSLTYVARQGGGGQGDIVDLFQKFNMETNKALDGNTQLAHILDANNIKLRDSTGHIRNNKELFYDVVDLINQAGGEQDRSTIAMAAFGKSAADMLPVLLAGSDELKTQESTARELGVVIDTDIVEKAAKFDDAWISAWDVFEANAKSSVVVAGSYLEGLIGQADAWLTSLGPGVKSSIQDAVGGALRSNPATAGTMAFLDLFKSKPSVGAAANSNVPLTPGNTEGKGNLYGTKTVVPSEAGISAAQTAAARAATVAEAAERRRLALLAQHAEGVRRVIDALKLENSQVGMSNVQKEISNRLAEAHVSLMSKEGQEIVALVQKNMQAIQVQQDAAFAAEKLIERQQEVRDGMMALAEMSVSAFDAIVIQGQSAEETLKSLVKQLASAALQATLLGQGPLAGLFGTASGGGFFGNLFGAGKSFSGLYADGGSIPSGSWGIAGEAGPEIIHGPASVIPMGQAANSNGGNVIYHIDARGADAQQIAVLSNRLMNMERNQSRNVKVIVANEKKNNMRFGN